MKPSPRRRRLRYCRPMLKFLPRGFPRNAIDVHCPAGITVVDQCHRRHQMAPAGADTSSSCAAHTCLRGDEPATGSWRSSRTL